MIVTYEILKSTLNSYRASDNKLRRSIEKLSSTSESEKRKVEITHTNTIK